MSLDSEVLISVIIPTFNRLKQLNNCLLSLAKQSLDVKWEVIVVDDGGQVKLNTLINKFESDLKITLLTQVNKGPAAARNYGVKYASGEFLAFLDDDCEPHEHWLTNLFDNAKPGMLVGGQTINKLKFDIYAESSQLLVSFLYEYFKDTPWYFFTSNNFSMDKRSFNQIGGFDEGFETSAGEDREFCIRWTNAGYNMNYVGKAIVWHLHEMTFVSFLKLHFKYGRAAKSVIKKILKLKIPSLRPKGSFYSGGITFILRTNKYSFHWKILFSMLFLLSQACVLAGYIASKR